MSNLIRGFEHESGGPAAAAHSRTYKHYNKIISRTDRSGLAQSESVSGDLCQIHKHLVLHGDRPLASICGITSVAKAYLMVLRMAMRRYFFHEGRMVL